jgi:transposase
LLCQLAGRRDFLYVADSKLATSDNMRHIDRHGGRFVSVLPRTRGEDAAFRARLREGQVVWEPIWDKQDEDGQLLDRFSVCPEPTLTAEGFRLVWYHSTRKADLDAAARAHKIDRALRQLGQLRQKLASPRTRHRQAEKLRKKVADILQECGAEDWIQVEIESRDEETYRQSKPGRPGKKTRYVRRVKHRLVLDYQIDVVRVAEASTSDGVFPLVTNVTELSPRELLFTYKRQPTIEKRFSQLKTDFAVAPVYLKEVRRIQALLCVYFFALLVEALLERELRRAMQREHLDSLPMYPEGRPCSWPTARRLIDLFEPVQRHTLTRSQRTAEVIVTELTRLQRKLLKLLKLPTNHYGQ